MHLKLFEWESVDWIDLAQAMNRWRALVNKATNLRVSVNARDFFVG
jgi:hypothetical protein